nr:hypothetical protein [Candidatus Poseidoniales archaeon]
DCDDNDSERSPDANETWNWIDDDCDGDIDNDVNRSAHVQFYIQPTPLNNSSSSLNSSYQKFIMLIWVENVSFTIPDLLNNSVVNYWMLTWPDGSQTSIIGEYIIDSGNEGLVYSTDSIDCSEPLGYSAIEQVLCPRHNETVGPWIVTFTLSDGDEVVKRSWPLFFEVWNPPVEDAIENGNNGEGDSDSGTNNETGELGLGGPTISNEIVIGLGAVLVLLMAFMMVTRKKPPKGRPRPRPRPILLR